MTELSIQAQVEQRQVVISPLGRWIVCKKKRGEPRIDLRICEKKCGLKEECDTYKAATGERKPS